MQLETPAIKTRSGDGRFLRNTWYVAMWSADLEPGRLVARTLLNEALVFFRNARGAAIAMADRCPHRLAPLSRGELLDDGTVKCGYHGLRFNEHGSCVYNPHGNHVIPPAAVADTYPVVEKHSLIWIWLGNEVPRPEDIPDFSVLDSADPAMVSKRDFLTMSSGYEIISDNLMDLSHVCFLHDGLLGNEQAIEAETSVEQKGSTVTATRIARNVPVPAMFDLMFHQDGEAVDYWLIMRSDVPSYFLLDTGVCEPGALKNTGSGIFGIHLLTPETATTTHYHFAAVRQNPPKRTIEDELAIREKLSAMRRFAFEEQDEPMLEAQQQRLLQNPDVRPVLLAIDAGPVRTQKIVRMLIDAEQARSAP